MKHIDDELSIIRRLFTSMELLNDNKRYIVWDEDNRVVYKSNFIEDFINLREDSFIEDKWSNYFSEENKSHIHNYMTEIKENTAEAYIFTTKYLHYKLTHKKVKNMCLYICQIEDRSELDTLKDQVESLQDIAVINDKMKISNELTAGLIHEIRNPLTAIKGFIQLLQAGIEQKDDYYRVIIEEIEKIEEISSELLSMSKPQIIKREAIRVIDLLEDTLHIFKFKQQYKDIRFSLICDDQVEIDCHKIQMRQVFINIIKNAAEAMNFKGLITVNVSETEDKTLIEFVDQGTGLTDELIEKIKQPFFTTKETGTGLGLVIIKQILDCHAAEMEIEANEGIGAIFKIIFPK